MKPAVVTCSLICGVLTAALCVTSAEARTPELIEQDPLVAGLEEILLGAVPCSQAPNCVAECPTLEIEIAGQKIKIP